jgi:hypothetical protein
MKTSKKRTNERELAAQSVSKRSIKQTKKKRFNVKRKRKDYDSDLIDNAINDMKHGLSARAASQKWHVPRTTLQNRKKSGFKTVERPGPAPVLTSDEENLLCTWLIELSHRGIPMQKQFLFDSIQKILTDDGRQNPFSHNRPGKGCFKAFLGRHSDLAERYAEPICRGRAQLTEGCVRGWFADAESFFRDRKCEYIMNDPSKQYNGDETGFQLDPRTGKVLTPKNEAAYTECGGTKEQLTVLVTTRADGVVMPSAIVYPYKRAVPKDIVENVPEGFFVANRQRLGFSVLFVLNGRTLPALAYLKLQPVLFAIYADHRTTDTLNLTFLSFARCRFVAASCWCLKQQFSAKIVIFLSYVLAF